MDEFVYLVEEILRLSGCSGFFDEFRIEDYKYKDFTEEHLFVITFWFRRGKYVTEITDSFWDFWPPASIEKSIVSICVKARAQLDELEMPCIPEIDKVIFNNPATIVFWNDGTKTVVKVKSGEEFDAWTGLAMAHMKKLYGDKFHHVFKTYCKKEDEQ